MKDTVITTEVILILFSPIPTTNIVAMKYSEVEATVMPLNV
jgi:hypothetical protein